MIRPVYPVLEYYINYDYISTVLCENKEIVELDCNGKCYLKKQLKEQKSPLENENPNHVSIDLEKYPVSLLGLFSCKLKNTVKLNKKHYILNFGKTKKYISKVFHPPTFLIDIC